VVSSRASDMETPDGTARFEALLDRGERHGTRGLPFDALSELGRLYRAHVARLARLRERDDDPAAIRHLNALCVRAYTLLYVPPPGDRSFRRLLLETLPRAIGATWRVQAVAWSLLVAGGVLGFVLAWRDPSSLHALVSRTCGYTPERIDRLVASPEERIAFLAHAPTPVGLNALFGSSLFVHNTRVGLLAFATGILAGVPTVLLHLYNGILVGAFASIFFHDPWPVDFLAWILPHGIPELTAITLCAAAGLLLGAAVAAPGRRGRREALRAATNPALLLFAGSLPLFGVAALVESFVRESALGTAPRLGIAATFAAALALMLLAVRRLARRVAVDAGWVAEVSGPDHDEARGTGSGAPP
jgi:uncharacterized membrane protein SpoIIM required for sporulation